MTGSCSIPILSNSFFAPLKTIPYVQLIDFPSSYRYICGIKYKVTDYKVLLELIVLRNNTTEAFYASYSWFLYF